MRSCGMTPSLRGQSQKWRDFMCRAWGGGSACADGAAGVQGPEIVNCFDEKFDPYPPGTCFREATAPLCDGNGDVRLPFGCVTSA